MAKVFTLGKQFPIRPIDNNEVVVNVDNALFSPGLSESFMTLGKYWDEYTKQNVFICYMRRSQINLSFFAKFFLLPERNPQNYAVLIWDIPPGVNDPFNDDNFGFYVTQPSVSRGYSFGHWINDRTIWGQVYLQPYQAQVVGVSGVVTEPRTRRYFLSTEIPPLDFATVGQVVRMNPNRSWMRETVLVPSLPNPPLNRQFSPNMLSQLHVPGEPDNVFRYDTLQGMFSITMRGTGKSGAICMANYNLDNGFLTALGNLNPLTGVFLSPTTQWPNFLYLQVLPYVVHRNGTDYVQDYQGWDLSVDTDFNFVIGENISAISGFKTDSSDLIVQDGGYVGAFNSMVSNGINRSYVFASPDCYGSTNVQAFMTVDGITYNTDNVFRGAEVRGRNFYVGILSWQPANPPILTIPGLDNRRTLYEIDLDNNVVNYGFLTFTPALTAGGSINNNYDMRVDMGDFFWHVGFQNPLFGLQAKFNVIRVRIPQKLNLLVSIPNDIDHTGTIDFHNVDRSY